MLAVAGGDIDAFNEIVHRHQHIAWSVAYRFLADPREAEDLAQEAFLKIFTAAPRYKATAAFRTYLYQVVTRLCIDNVRKKRPFYNSDFPESPDYSPGPEGHLILNERKMKIHRAIDTLPPRQRLTIILKYYEGLNYTEIARIMKITIKAVERLLSRARRALQSELSQYKNN